MAKKSKPTPLGVGARNEQWAAVAHELRQGNRAQPIPSGKVYKRRPKHREKQWY